MLMKASSTPCDPMISKGLHPLLALRKYLAKYSAG
jgi:hypothetical protein